MSSVAERMVRANGVELCTDAIGEPSDPPILLVMGMSASMVWFDDEFCRRLADERRLVIRYDHRDTGRSVSYEPGRPPYTASDLVADAPGVLDAHGLAAAHIIGVSMGGALAQMVALHFPGRVLSLTLVSTSLAVPRGRELPSSDDRLGRFLATVQVDWSDEGSVVDYLVGYWRVLWGQERAFDEAYIRRLAERDVARTRDIAATQNHALAPAEGAPRGPVSSITAPTLVIHGTADPMFPLEHGQALTEEIQGARLLALEGAGHGIDPLDWDKVIGAIVDHTNRSASTP